MLATVSTSPNVPMEMPTWSRISGSRGMIVAYVAPLAKNCTPTDFSARRSTASSCVSSCVLEPTGDAD